MQRTQIYLTERQRDELAALARRAGKNQSELIREAVERLLDRDGPGGRKAALAQAAGMWRDRADLPDLTTLRAEWDRE
jgi:Arc/MetJ-type ribon-helix-helix transcriptional regulator